ncbi:DUF3040 domain-containing protein [Haloechinothrix halophila]|uniref:DUF3040 domain-containing protein n=1 Tax=Haloechinothrix halophila TaxID=1069073 RepID=UPI0005598A5A|nr:DUF3040 domain-containing protein [Haloechinothrix halophila]
MLNQRDRRQLAILARHLAEDDPALVAAFQNWRPPDTETDTRFAQVSLAHHEGPGAAQANPRLRSRVALLRWWGAIFAVCGVALAVLTVLGTTLETWSVVALGLTALSGVFGLATLGFWLAYRNVVTGRRRGRRHRRR